MKKVAVITGGAGGIGRATAIALSKQCDIIVIGDLFQEYLEYADKIFDSLNIEHHNMQMDIRDRKSCDAFVQYAAGFGKIQCFINIAGVCPRVSYTDLPYSTSRHTYETNCIGALNALEAAFPYMEEGSVMVQTASQSADFAPLTPELIEVFKSCYEEGFLDRLCALTAGYENEIEASGQAYCFSKLFVRQMVRANGRRFAKKGARIVSISPGPHLTRQVEIMEDAEREIVQNYTPMGCFGRTVDLGRVYAFVCSDTAKYITGTDILVDGGGVSTMGPWQID